jgi:hypothetical protein
VPTPPPALRRLAYAGAHTALAVGICYLEQIPWFELQSVVVFAAGYLLGARTGALVGGLAMGLYSLANPYGLAHPVVLASQVIGRAFVGLSGGWAQNLGLPRSTGGRAAVLVRGRRPALFYDLLTNVASGVVFRPWCRLWSWARRRLRHLARTQRGFAIVGATYDAASRAGSWRHGARFTRPGRCRTRADSTAGSFPTRCSASCPTPPAVVVPRRPSWFLRGPARWAIETNAQERLRHAPLGTDDAWSAVGTGAFLRDKGDVER